MTIVTVARWLMPGFDGYMPAMPTSTADRTRDHSAILRLFRNRETGDIVIIQMPNIPLWIFLAATAVRLLFQPNGSASTVVSLVSGVSLAVWAVAEIARGASPFRRVLGAVVLVGLLAELLIR